MSEIRTTKEDQDNAWAVAATYARRGSKRQRFRMEKPLAPVDATFKDEYGHREVAEIVCRTASSDRFKDYMISREKLRKLARYARDEHAKPILLVRWVDKVGKLVLDSRLKKYVVDTGGRYDRNDRNDIESCVYIPIEENFEMLFTTDSLEVRGK